MNKTCLRYCQTIIYSACLLIFLLTGCTKNGAPPLLPKDGSKLIISFGLKNADGTPVNATAVVKDSTISITVPFITDRSRLTPDVVIKGLSLSPASGVTQNFTMPVV